MASTQTMPSTPETGKNPLAFTIFPNEDEEVIDYIPEPHSSDEKTAIREKQVLIPYSIHNKLYAFLGPYPIKRSYVGKVSRFFPGYSTSFPSTFEECTLNLSFMVKPTCVFRSAPPTLSKEYISWLDKVQS